MSLRLQHQTSGLLLPVASLLLLLLLSGCGGVGTLQTESTEPTQPTENWPAYTPSASWKPLVEQAVADYTEQDITYKPYLQTYTVSGDWLNTSVDTWEASDSLHFDSDGVPMVSYGGVFYYNPVTVAEFTLSMYGKYIRGTLPTDDSFFSGVNRLLLMQDSSGAFRYPFAWQYYLSDQPFQPGWTSAMAQGLGLSVFARAYELSGDPKYLDAGDEAFTFLLTKTDMGGVADTMAYLDPSLSSQIMFEEYVVDPASYTLNGFMFTLLGVYDWSKTRDSNHGIAASTFSGAIDTLDHILPYYDIGGFSAYDMSHIIYKRTPHIGVHYHAIHIYLLHALGSVTQDATLSHYEKLWASYVPQ